MDQTRDEIGEAEWRRRQLDATQRRAWREAGLYSGLTLGQQAILAAGKFPGCPLVFVSRQRPGSTTMAEAVAKGLEAASVLQRLGLRAGDRLVAQVPHWMEMFHIEVACFALGVVLVPVVSIYGPSELGFILRQTRAKGLILPDRWRGQDYSARLADVGATPDLQHVIVVGEEACSGPVLYWHDLIRDARPIEALPAVDPDGTALIIYTSGTTAAPKGVQHSHHSMGYELNSSGVFREIRERQPHLGAFPGGHAAGFLAMGRPLFHGNKLVVLDHFEPAVAVDIILEHGIVASGGTPVHFSRLVEAAAGRPLPTLKSYLVGSTSVAPAMIEMAEEFGIHAYRCYGGSEHPTVTTNLPEWPLKLRAYTDGKLLPNCAIRLVDEGEREVAAGEAGEILFHGPELMLGYLATDLNDEAFDEKGWYRTGDIGVLDGEGNLNIVDRKKDIIIRGGEKLSSKDIEDVLHRHPAVLEAAVVGWPDPIYGERVAAVLRLAPGRVIDLDMVRDHFAAAGLAKQKTPEHLIIVEDFPRTAAGKIQKPPLREKAKAMAQKRPA